MGVKLDIVLTTRPECSNFLCQETENKFLGFACVSLANISDAVV